VEKEKLTEGVAGALRLELDSQILGRSGEGDSNHPPFRRKYSAISLVIRIKRGGLKDL